MNFELCDVVNDYDTIDNENGQGFASFSEMIRDIVSQIAKEQQ